MTPPPAPPELPSDPPPSLSPRAARVYELFLAACNLAEEERGSFLERACGGDADLHAELRSLLAHDVTDGSTFESPARGRTAALGDALAHADLPPVLPEAIGPFRILGVIGSGGMGVVYRAEQESPRRQVALKVVRQGLADERTRRRFVQEAEILARLQHPGIAQIYQAGTADAGEGPQPYFAMELVDGEALTDYANRRSLGLEDRVELLAEIADAVHYAHQRGVIHRDLKPANILVGADGRPKILDFGVARVADSEVQLTTAGASFQRLVGTLPYMSPEQVAGDREDLDTRSDVYALGVIAYELLAGRRPHDLARRSLAEAARVIAEEAPQPLSSVDRVFRGDLETIVAKAMEKEKTRRYGSASDLGTDLRRFLRNEPIIARPASALYQLRKFSRRNQGLVAALGAGFLLLIGGTVGMSIALAKASAANASLDVANQRAVESARIAQENEAAAARDARIATNALSFLEGIFTSADTHETEGPALTLDLALDRGISTIGDLVTGEPFVEAKLRAVLGKVLLSVGRYDDALAIIDAMSSADLPSGQEIAELLREHRRIRGESYLSLDRLKEAEVVLTELVEECKTALGPEAGATLDAVQLLGRTYSAEGRFADADLIFRELLQVRLRLARPGDHDTLSTRINLAANQVKLGQFDEAEEALLAALAEMRQTAGEDHPDSFSILNSLGNLAMERGQLERAAEFYSEALDRKRRVLGMDHPRTLTALHNLAVLRTRQSRFEDAEKLYQEILQTSDRVFGRDHQVTKGHLITWASYCVQTGRLGEADAVLAQVLVWAETTFGKEHEAYLTALLALAHLRLKQGATEEGLRIHAEATGSQRKVFGQHDPRVLNSENCAAGHLVSLGRGEEAVALLSSLRERVLLALGDHHASYALVLSNLALSLKEAGRPAEAHPIYEESLALSRSIHGDLHSWTLTALDNLGSFHLASGRHEEGLAMVQEALEGRRALLGEDAPETLISYVRVAGAMGAIGDWRKARDLLATVLEARERTVGPTDLATLEARHELAKATAQLGELREAVELCRQALAGYRAQVGESDQRTITCMESLAGILAGSKAYQEAHDLLTSALAIQVGRLDRADPALLRIHTSLGYNLANLRKLEEAESEFRVVVDTTKEARGVDDPSTLAAMTTLAAFYGHFGMLDLAADTEREILASLIRRHGDASSEATASRAKLAATLRRGDRTEDACAMLAAAAEQHPEDLGCILSYAQFLGQPPDPVPGREAEALALAQRGIELAGDADRVRATLTLAWALHANGRTADALEALEACLPGASAQERASIEGSLELLRAPDQPAGSAEGQAGG